MLTIVDPSRGQMPASLGPLAVTIGNFDGCHRGHRSLIEATLRLAATCSAAPAALSFSPRPEAFFRGVGAEALLFTESQKARAFAELGLAYHVVQTFDAAFSQTTHDEFYARVLRGALKARAIVVGDNFRFGRGRQGDTHFLEARGTADGLRVEIMKPALHDGSVISSTRIRQSLAQGRAEDAAAMLGRPYLIEGVIRRGDQLGRQLGVPTANLEGVAQLVPSYGIYAGFVVLGEASVMTLDERAIPAVFSLGVRPTLQNPNPPLRIEAHLLEGDYGPDSLYGLKAGYYFTAWLRGEERFPDLAALQAQMAKDIARARTLTAGKLPHR